MASPETEERNKLLLLHLKQAMGHSDLPKTEIQDLMRQATKSLKCNAACQKRKEIDNLKQKWLQSESHNGEKLKNKY